MLWLVLAALACVFIYLWVIKPLSYWKERGIPYRKPWPLVGNMAPVIFKNKAFMELSREIYTDFSDKRYNGFHRFMKPALIVRDIDLIKKITVKDFDHFTDHNPFIPDNIDPLFGRSLFSLKGQRWREMRSTLSPSFTSSKMKGMFTLLSECSEQFTQYFEKEVSGVKTMEMRDVFTKFTNDAIASIAFGLKVDSLEDQKNEFYTMGARALNFSGLASFRILLTIAFPPLARFFGLKVFPQSVSNFFHRIVRETIQQREKKGIVRPDMIHLLMEARKGRLNHDHGNDIVDAGYATVEESHVGKMEKHRKLDLSDDDITAQAFLFFIGGFETTATLMSFLAYELAVNPDVQEKLQREIDCTLAKCNGKVTYEALLSMKYLDGVVSETLRKWPPGFIIDRVCVSDYLIAAVDPTEKPYTLRKGEMVIIPIYGIHSDPNIFPNPDKFDPERFSEENKHSIIPGSYMPFGAGPRSCIASRVALLENKILFFHLLSKFEIVVVEETVVPLKLGTKVFRTTPDDGVWLGLRRRKVA